MGPVIAERHLTLHRRGKRTLPVLVRIGRPRPWPEALHGDWMCTFQVVGLGDEKVRYVCGVDAMQAMLLAAHRQPDNIAALARAAGGECRWLGSTEIWGADGSREAARHEKPIPKMPRKTSLRAERAARQQGRRTTR